MTSTSERENEIAKPIDYEEESSHSVKKRKKSKTEDKEGSHHDRKLNDHERKHGREHKEHKKKKDKSKSKKLKDGLKVEPDVKPKENESSSRISLLSAKGTSGKSSEEPKKAKSVEKDCQTSYSQVVKRSDKATQSDITEDKSKTLPAEKRISKEEMCHDYITGIRAATRWDFCNDVHDSINRRNEDGRESNYSIAFNQRLGHRDASTNLLEKSCGSCHGLGLSKMESCEDLNQRNKAETAGMDCEEWDRWCDEAGNERDITGEVMQGYGWKNVAVLTTFEDDLDKKRDAFDKKHDRFAKRQDGFAKKQDGFAKKQDGFAKKQDSFARKQDSFNRKHDNFARKQESFNRKRDGSAKKRDSSAKKQDGFAKKFDGFDKKQDGFDKRYDDYDKIHDNFDKRYDGFDRKQDSYDKKEDSFEKRYDGFDGKQDGFDKMSDGYDKTQDSFDKRYDGFNRKQVGYDKKQDSFEKKYDGFDRKQDNFEKRYDGFDRKQDNFEKRYDGFDRKQDGDDKKQDSFDRRHDGFDKKKDPFEDKNHQSGFPGSDMSDLKKGLMRIQSELDRLKISLELLAAEKGKYSPNKAREHVRYGFAGCVPDLAKLREKLKHCLFMKVKLCHEYDCCPSPGLWRKELDNLKNEVNAIKIELENIRKNR